MTHRSRLLGGLAGVALILATATAALGYAGQVAGSVTLAVGTIACSGSATVTATILETGTGSPIEGQPVNFGFETSMTGDSLSASTATTNAAGQASVTLTLGAASGTRTVFAVADDVRGEVAVTCAAAQLPNTSTAPVSQIPALLSAALAALGGGALLGGHALRRR